MVANWRVEPSPSPSFSVAESSHLGHDMKGKGVAPATPVPRMLARTGEPFRFRVALTLPAAAATALDMRLVSSTLKGSPKSTTSSHSPDAGAAGEKLPRFIKVEHGTGKIGECSTNEE